MKYTEILKLKSMLEEAKIPFEFTEKFGGYQIGYPKLPNQGAGFICSVVEHRYSFGSDDDLLEILGLTTYEEGDPIVGYLTAENVFRRISKHYEFEKKMARKRKIRRALHTGLKIFTALMLLTFLISLCAMDSDSWLPLIACPVSLFWCLGYVAMTDVEGGESK